MADERDRLENLKAFAAALAALRPNGEGLNRDRLMFLAGQALVRPDEARSSGTRLRRWGWPAAFAAMSTIAASLLVALAVRPPQVVERIVAVAAEPPHTAIAGGRQQDRDRPRDREPPAPAPWRPAEPPGDWLAFVWTSLGQQPAAPLSPIDACRYKRLRDLAVVRGLDAWPMPAALAAAGSGVSPRSRPACQRELLDELLERPKDDRPELPEASPESTSHPGAKS